MPPPLSAPPLYVTPLYGAGLCALGCVLELPCAGGLRLLLDCGAGAGAAAAAADVDAVLLSSGARDACGGLPQLRAQSAL